MTHPNIHTSQGTGNGGFASPRRLPCPHLFYPLASFPLRCAWSPASLRGAQATEIAPDPRKKTRPRKFRRDRRSRGRTNPTGRLRRPNQVGLACAGNEGRRMTRAYDRPLRCLPGLLAAVVVLLLPVGLRAETVTFRNECRVSVVVQTASVV